VAAWRRRWHAGRPEGRRRLASPVISVGALAVGGSGKTPVAEHIARLLLEMGERPAILSRGYGRSDPVDGVVVVRDATGLIGTLETAGDEPWMLARSLEGVVVVVASDRYLAGTLAETCLGATVHVLDDGFQHVALERDTDLVVLSGADLDEGEVLPAGRLREPLATVSDADALLLNDMSDAHRDRVERELVAGQQQLRVFRLRRQVGKTHSELGLDTAGTPERGGPVIAVAGIARPARFFEDVRHAGFDVVRTLAFPDHHRYGRRAINQIQKEARAVGADAIVTTQKDFVRLESWLPFDLPLTTFSLTVSVSPRGPFRAFLRRCLVAARGRAA